MLKEIYGNKYPGYFVDELGSVYSTRSGALRRLSQSVHEGYLHVRIRDGGHPSHEHKVPVHRLVLSTFAGARPEGMECRHLNGNALDNRLENLAWGTHKENMNDEIAQGTAACLRHGEKHNCAKLTNKEVEEIRSLKDSGMTQSEIAKRYGVTQRHVSDILNWKTRCFDS